MILPIIFKNLLKTFFSLINILINLCLVRLDCYEYFLFEKQALLKVISCYTKMITYNSFSEWTKTIIFLGVLYMRDLCTLLS